MDKIAQKEKVYTAYKELENMDEKQLKKLKLTPAEYHDAWETLRELHGRGSCMTICKSVADYYKKRKFTVAEHGIGWLITL